MQTISVEKAKEDFYQIMDKVSKGEKFVITKDNNPMGELQPVHIEKKKRKPGSAKGLIEIGKDFDEPLEEFKEYT